MSEGRWRGLYASLRDLAVEYGVSHETIRMNIRHIDIAALSSAAAD